MLKLCLKTNKKIDFEIENGKPIGSPFFFSKIFIISDEFHTINFLKNRG